MLHLQEGPNHVSAHSLNLEYDKSDLILSNRDFQFWDLEFQGFSHHTCKMSFCFTFIGRFCATYFWCEYFPNEVRV